MRLFDRKLYRARDGRIFGVCKGLARAFDLSVRGVRLVALVLLFLTGIWPMVGLYVLAALLMPPEPVVPFASEDDREFYDSYAGSRGPALARLKRKFESVDRRIRRLEDHVTSRDYDWERRMRGGV